MGQRRCLFVAAALLGAWLPLTARAETFCFGQSSSNIARAVKLASTAHDTAARRGSAPDLSHVDRVRVSAPCRAEVIALSQNLSELCYGSAFDPATGSFPTPVADRCARLAGRTCTRALFKEIRSPGAGRLEIDKLAKRCGDPITGDLGDACDGVTANAAVRTCLTAEIGAMAAAINPHLLPVSAAACGFPGSDVVKPVVAGAEFAPAISPWLQTIVPGQAYEPAAADQSQIDYIRPKGDGVVNLSVREWTIPVYNIVSNVDTDCPASLRSRCFDQVTIEDVYLTAEWNPTGHALLHVPIPAETAVRPDPKADSELAIVDWVHGIEYDFWACSKNTDGTWRKIRWPYSRGGDRQLHYACRAGGKLYLEGAGINLIGPDSAKGSGLALTGGLIRLAELLPGGTIAHALTMTITAAASGGPIPPANLSDGDGPSYPDAPPEGARIQLRPELWSDAVIEARPWTDVEKKIARALRDYGAIIADQGGSDIDFYVEGAASDPHMYDGVTGIGPGPATELFDPGFFSPQNFRFLEEAPQHGLDEAGVRDLDGDGMFDSFEIAMGWFDQFEVGSPPNASDDPDGDGLSNLEEQRCLHSTWVEHLASWPGFADNRTYQYPCNPYDADTDHDGFNDPVELSARTDPADPCSHP